MSEHSNSRRPVAPADSVAPSVPELPPQPAAEQSEAPDTEAVKGGMGVNRLVVTNGPTKG